MQTAQTASTNCVHSEPRHLRRQFARQANAVRAQLLNQPRTARSQPLCRATRQQQVLPLGIHKAAASRRCHVQTYIVMN